MKAANWLENLPIKRKLTLVMLSACTVVLLFACGILAGYEWFEFRRTMVRDTDGPGRCPGPQHAGGPDFSGRERRPRQPSWRLPRSPMCPPPACTRTMAGYSPITNAPASPRSFRRSPVMKAIDFEHGHLVLVHVVMLDQKRIGTIYLKPSWAGCTTSCGCSGSSPDLC